MGFFSNIVSSGIDYLASKDANKSSAKQAKRQMEFQERMSSTAHQREVADLKAAGLNPVLSLGGLGASTPGGAMGQVSVPTPGRSYQEAASAGASRSLTKEQARTQEDTRAALKAQAGASEAAASASSAQAAKTALEAAGQVELNRQIPIRTAQIAQDIINSRVTTAAAASSGRHQDALTGLVGVQSKLANLEESKQGVLKSGYDLVQPLIESISGWIKESGAPSAASSAKQLYESAKERRRNFVPSNKFRKVE